MAVNPASHRQPRQAVTPPRSGSSFDIIIIGGGTIGLSAAYYAAARGLNTLLLEQFDTMASGYASSGGASRMFRIMYSPTYMAQLAETSLALWKEIETASGLEILETQPLIFYGDSENTVEGNLGAMQKILANLGVPYTWHPNAAGLMQQYPAFQTMPTDYVGLVQPNSAVIRAETSITAFETLATAAGATLLSNQPATVTSISTEGPYEVSCPAGAYSAPQLVLCPGAWTNSLLEPFGVQLSLTIWQMTVAYFQADVTNYAYPLWYEFGPTSQQLFYGFPPDEVPGSLKVSADFTNNIYTDPSQCTYQPDPQILSQLGAFLQQRFNGVQPTPADASTCLYTMSADAQMILDRLGGDHNVAIFTGASGRGFKFTPLFGRILVDLATTGQTYYDVSPFSISRPKIIKH
jgi:sarcosine oxidase / L-pipecolate oxidase